MLPEMEEWAEDHGYSRYRCPNCKYTFWTDSAVVCERCGEGEEGADSEETEEDEAA